MAQAKIHVKSTKVKKGGRNTYSEYDYFTPAQVDKIVSDACEENGLLTTFSLTRNELGETGFLKVYDIESEECLTFEMATAIPKITATNMAQQLGGCVTYTERYLKMSAFGITDSTLDFDTTENTKKAQTPPKEPAKQPADFNQLDEAVKEMKAAKNRAESDACWLTHKELQKETRFINAAKEAAQKYPKV